MNATYEPITENDSDLLYRLYSTLPLNNLIAFRESVAIKPNESYKIGQNPDRDRKLKALDKVISKRIPDIFDD